MEKDNKLIAEFMGEKFTDNLGVVQGLNYKLIEKKHGKGNNGFRFHTSWDWLMPVVDKIKILVMEDDSDELYNSEEWDNITHTLVQIEIKSVYKAVVEFIKNQNN
tara:strand:- start:2801 stop:3115 length:315 start_codon:yes stop_codon:yes gene_type:complete